MRLPAACEKKGVNFIVWLSTNKKSELKNIIKVFVDPPLARCDGGWRIKAQKESHETDGNFEWLTCVNYIGSQI